VVTQIKARFVANARFILESRILSGLHLAHKNRWELSMIRFVILIVINAIAASTIPEPICAQTSPPGTEAPMTGIKPDRTVADKTSRQVMREKEAALKQKRSECRKQAKIQKVSLLKQQRFIHDCMSN
jgi:hypothetical protein